MEPTVPTTTTPVVQPVQPQPVPTVPVVLGPQQAKEVEVKKEEITTKTETDIKEKTQVATSTTISVSVEKPTSHKELEQTHIDFNLLSAIFLGIISVVSVTIAIKLFKKIDKQSKQCECIDKCNNIESRLLVLEEKKPKTGGRPRKTQVALK